jgi:hypothetical protein
VEQGLRCLAASRSRVTEGCGLDAYTVRSSLVLHALVGILQAPGRPPRRPPCSCGCAAAVLQRRVSVNATLNSSTAGAMASDVGKQTVDPPLTACSSALVDMMSSHPARSACSTACWHNLCSCLAAHACLVLPCLPHSGGLRPSSSLSQPVVVSLMRGCHSCLIAHAHQTVSCLSRGMAVFQEPQSARHCVPEALRVFLGVETRGRRVARRPTVCIAAGARKAA